LVSWHLTARAPTRIVEQRGARRRLRHAPTSAGRHEPTAPTPVCRIMPPTGPQAESARGRVEKTRFFTEVNSRSGPPCRQGLLAERMDPKIDVFFHLANKTIKRSHAHRTHRQRKHPGHRQIPHEHRARARNGTTNTYCKLQNIIHNLIGTTPAHDARRATSHSTRAYVQARLLNYTIGYERPPP